jgi:hypothetical protein
MICTIAGHKAAARTIWNAGTHFGKCTRCSTDLIEVEGRWHTPPPWFRVVWRKREPAPEASLPAPPPIDLAPKKVTVAAFNEERSGGDRRTNREGRPASLRVERRRGSDRRKGAKAQAISRP